MKYNAIICVYLINNTPMNEYHTILIFLSFLILYLISWSLTRFKIYSLITHRKIWNIILLVSFLVAGILGLILANSLDHKKIISWYTTGLWLHVEFGIAMTTISLMHIIWHWKYYLKILKIKKHD